ncbi:hypothetical protein [Novosphingobium album (ex Liu et al. 2023)]|uniref:Uncharacterized protein n=1 Tax=Novosphingobium album (ex Liu et al. 2023) TaxID=3031130 RepID=A0ABT5WVE3_9SPHN|nr:hypothetical protein [Novosphingobium album (ex Liu et al. 2023)]MDE8653828.1 hypothetical protein [Novosphingobium album (ex Liu et al. 2023)]
MRLALGGAILPLALLAAGPACASGGEHVVDDAAVETPGTCHLESWVTLSSGGGLVNSAPACTRKAWPNLEIGGFVTHSWTESTDDTLIGLSPKLMLRSEDRGIGIGIATSVGYGIQKGRFETASAIVPVTIPAGDKLRFNLNAGWLWARAGHRHDMFVGAQAEIALRKNLNVMVETFTRDQGKVGGQAGLRWTVAGGAVDLDLIGGRHVDGATRSAITFGVTVRR